MKSTAETTLNKVPVHQMINFDDDDIAPKVSVIVPVCNVATYLDECIQSIIGQTLRDIEIICINDGSTDNSLEILEKYAAIDKRVKVIDKDNAGYGHAMNIGSDKARGEYVGIVESDDYIAPEMYEELYNVAKKYDLDVVKSNFNRFIGPIDNRTLFFNKVAKKQSNYGVVLNPRERMDVFDFVMNTWSGIYRRQFLIDNDIRYNETPGASFQDNGFFFQTTMRANGILFVDKAYYFNRRDNENSSVMSKKKINCMKEEYDYIDEILSSDKEYHDKFIKMSIHKRFGNYLFTYGRIENIEKSNYIKNVSKEYKEYRKQDLLDYSLYSDVDAEKLKFIMNDVDGFIEASTPTGSTKISVITPVYNGEQFIDECLKSVLDQTIPDLEVILIDDGSTDGSIDRINQYISDPRIKLIRQENSGSGIARNKGMEAATGEYIAFMDCDDYYPNKNVLSNLYIIAKRNNAKICGGSFSRLEKGRIVTKFEGAFSKYTFDSSGFTNFKDYEFDYGYHRFIYSRDLINKQKIIFPDYKRYQDPPFFVKAMSSAKKFYHLPIITYCYRKRDVAMTWDIIKVKDMLKGIRDNLQISSKNGYAELHYNNIMRINKDYLNVIMEQVKTNDVELLLLLIEIQSSIDLDLTDQYVKMSRPFVIKPLYRLMTGYSKSLSKDNTRTVISPSKTENNPIKKAISIEDCCEQFLENYNTSNKEPINKFIETIQDKGWIPSNVLKVLNKIGTEKSYDAMIILAKYYADNKNGNAMNILGRAYRDGTGVEKNLQEAAAWMRKASDCGNKWSKSELLPILWDIHTDDSLEEMVTIAQELEKKNDPRALGSLGRAYLHGVVFEKDHSKASDYLLRSSKGGVKWAKKEYEDLCKCEAKMDEQNDQMKKLWKTNKHNELFEVASGLYKEGNPTAAGYLGRIYREGKVVDKDLTTAEDFMRIASDSGLFWAQNELLDILWTNKKYDEVLELSNNYFEKGNYGAAARIGRSYRRGLGAPKDLDKAEHYLRIAIEQNIKWSRSELMAALLEMKRYDDLIEFANQWPSDELSKYYIEKATTSK